MIWKVLFLVLERFKLDSEKRNFRGVTLAEFIQTKKRKWILGAELFSPIGQRLKESLLPDGTILDFIS